ncbi:hypothetical protein SL103_07445 [Streptomyces lydicus]|uniref:Uncharacterized protein n=1 Tax=Streptomyces lydicus TaxID=47763 RepID=A0A1D7VH91_9ACTN|nr:hypothetical protein SL103_07445 [Streptomyces lydicus]
MLLRTGSIAERLEQDSRGDPCSVLAAISGLESSVPAERYNGIDDPSVDQCCECLVRRGGLCAATQIEIGHLLLEAPPGEYGVFHSAPHQITASAVVAYKESHRLIGLAKFSSERGSGYGISVDSVPQRCRHPSVG